MRPLSLDLRERVIAALSSGQTHVEVAKRFTISTGTVARLAKQWRQQKHLAPRPIPDRPRAVSDEEKALLQELTTTVKDATLARLAQALEEKTGKKVSKSALQRNLVWLKYSYKKSHVLPPNETPRSEPPSKRR